MLHACLLLLLNVFHLVRFKENIVIDPGSVDIFPPLRMPNNLHHLVKPICRSSDSFGSRSSMKEKGFRLVTDADSLSSILQYATDDEVNTSISCVMIHRMYFQWLGVLRKMWRFPLILEGKPYDAFFKVKQT